MKTILIVTGDFSIGGSRSSMYSLLSVLDPARIKVDVFAREKKGDLKDSMPNCTILPENIWLSHNIYEGNKLQKLICKILYFLRGIFQKIGFDLFRLYGYIGGKQIRSDKYDAVIGFDETMTRIICYYPAKKRISFLHCDYRRHTLGKDETKYLNRIDNIVCVSKFARDTLLEVCPQYADKAVVIRNAINVEAIVEKSKASIINNISQFSKEEIFTIISIGRLDPVKQFEKIPHIVAEVKEILKTECLTKKLQWLIVGGGNTSVETQIEEEIKKYDVANEVKLLGMQPNPYPYLAMSDLYVCTSASETFSYTIHEALALRIPFLCNTFPGASESVHVGQDGFIIPLEDMPLKIFELIKHPLRLNNCTITNDELLLQFYNLI